MWQLIKRGAIALAKFISKFISLRTLLLIAAVAIIVAIIMYGVGGGFGNGAGDGKGDGNTKVTSEYTSAAEDENDAVASEEITTRNGETQEDTYVGAIISINVVDKDYFYNNMRITLDEIVEEAKKIEGKVVVEVNDDGASYRAYHDLLDRLNKERIKYVEREKE